jgi:Fe-S oxidoreductase
MPELDELDSRIAALGPDDLARGLSFFHSRLKAADVAGLATCVHCGLCAESCHYYLATGEAADIPAVKLDTVLAVFKRHFTAPGRIAPHWFGARRFDHAAVRAWLDAVFGRCTLCGRCSLNCTVGIQLPAVLRAARGALTEMGVIPADLNSTVRASLDTGNNMGIGTDDFLETIQWLEEELKGETGDEAARIPVDKAGARVLFTVNPKEPKFYPLSLLASAKVFHAAGEDWTISSTGWDLTNYGLFTGVPAQGAAIARPMVEAAQRLGVALVAIGECGHGWAAARWEAPEWLQQRYGFKVASVLELVAGYLTDGRIAVDPARIKGRVTLHDPCNLVRHGGIFGPQREILKAVAGDFVEMTPNRERNYCCGGGGGQLSMGRFKARRLAAGKVKADQIRATGATIVAAPCHNCQDQLGELAKHYQLPVVVKGVTELVAEALVSPVPQPDGAKRCR